MLARVQVRVLDNYTSTSPSTSTGWRVRVTLRVPAYDLHCIKASVLHFSVSEKGTSDLYKPRTKLQLCHLVQWHFNLRIVIYWLSWLTITICWEFKNRKQKLRNIMKCVETSVFFKVRSKKFHTLTRIWMGKWTWKNDNNKHKHHNSNSVNFSMIIELKEVMEFAITSHVPYIQIVTE